MNPNRTRSNGARRLAWGAGLAFLALGGAWALAGDRSMDKAALRERLLALDKNAPIRARGLERRPLEVEFDGGREAFELTYLHVPCSSANVAPGAVPVVLVHGTPSTLCTWVEPIFGGTGFEGLSAQRDVYALEIVGHGMAEGSAAPYDFERCARFVGAALAALGLERVYLVGSSYGGEFAWRTALNEPQRIAGLVLADSSGYRRPVGGFLPEEVAMRTNPLAPWGWLLNSRGRIASALAPHFPTIPPDRVEEFYLVAANSDNWRAMVDLARDENGDREDEIARLAAPTLLVWGRDDSAYPALEVGARFARDIPQAKLVLLPSGHYPHEQIPAMFVGALEQFFSALER